MAIRLGLILMLPAGTTVAAPQSKQVLLLADKNEAAGGTDIVLTVMNEGGANKLMQSEFTLGGEGAVMAGPVGRSASAETDAYLHAEILSYSRARGVFAGVALKGGTLRSADDKLIYGRAARHEDILHGLVPASASAKALLDTLTKYSGAESN